MFSHISTSMKGLGRGGPWDPEARTGNPVDCDEVRLYKKGYGRLQRSRGFEEGSAVPWDEADVFAVIDQLDQEAAGAFAEAQQLLAAGRPMAAFSPYVRGLLLDRDALACSYEWHSLQRGKEAGSLTRSDFHDRHGKEVLSCLSSLLANEPEKVKVSSMQHATCSMLWYYTVLHAACCVRHWGVQYASCNMQHARYYTVLYDCCGVNTYC